MGWIVYNQEEYRMEQWRVQCFNCESILETWNGCCKCGLIIVKEGRKTWPFAPTKDVSIWKSPTGKILPQNVLDHYFLSRKTDKTRADTETSTSTS